MSRKAGIIAPSPPPPCTLLELVRMVRVMDIQEINLDAKKAIEHFINRGIYDFVEVANIGGNCDYSTVKPRIEYLDNVYGFLLNFYCENRINDISADYYSLNEQYNELIQKASDTVMAEYTPPDDFDNTDIKVYIYSLIFKRLAYFAMNNKHYFIALDLMHRSIQYETSYRTYNGLTIRKIMRNAPKPIQIHTRAKKESIIPLAQKIWEFDTTTHLLFPKRVAILIRELLELKKEEKPTEGQLIKWFKETKNLIPDEIKERDKNNDYGNTKPEQEAKEELIKKIKLELKDYCKSIVNNDL